MIKKNNFILLTNMLSYLMLQIINLFVGIIIPRLYLEMYGSEINGVISTINSFITYFSYLEAGIGLSLIHLLYKSLSNNDSAGINIILSYSKKQYHKISYIYLGFVLLLSFWFPFVSGSNSLTHIEFILLILVIGFYGVFDFYSMAKYRVLLTADKKEYIISYSMIVAQILRFVFTWIILQFNLSVVWAKSIPIITLFIRSIILKSYIEKQYPSITFDAITELDNLNTKNRWDALFLQITINTSIAFPVIVISQMLGYKEANVYAIYSLVISAVIAIVSALSSGVAPVFGERIVLKQNITDIYKVYEMMITFVLTLVFSVCAVMMLPFIKLYVSVINDINYIYSSYAILFSLWGALFTYRIPLTALINASALFRENRKNNIVNFLLQLILEIVFCYFWGIKGVLIAMILVALQRNIMMALVIERNLIQNTFNRSFLHQIIMCMVILSLYYVGSLLCNVDGITIISWIKNAILATVASSVVCIIVYMFIDFEIIKSIIKIIKNKWMSIII